MLEVAASSNRLGLPWKAGINGMNIFDVWGAVLFVGNAWHGEDSYETRLRQASERAEGVCKAMNMHQELVKHLGEVVALATELVRRIDWSAGQSGDEQQAAEIVGRSLSLLTQARKEGDAP